MIPCMDNEQEAEILESNDQQISDSNNIEISSEFQISVTRTTFDTSSPSEDGTTQDISSDIDSIQSPDHEQKSENKAKMEALKGNCNNNIININIYNFCYMNT